MLMSDSLNARYLGFHSVYFFLVKKTLVLSLFVLFFPQFSCLSPTLSDSPLRKEQTPAY